MPLRRDEPVTFLVRSSTLPLSVRVLVYDDVAADETPDVEQARRLDCTAGQGCTMASSPTGFSVTLSRQPRYPAVTVLLLAYPTYEDADRRAGIPAYSASWAVRLKAT